MGKEKIPASVVVVVCVRPVSKFRAVTLAPATAPPLGSVIEPSMLPLVVCARRETTVDNIRSANVKMNFFMDFPLAALIRS